MKRKLPPLAIAILAIAILVSLVAVGLFIYETVRIGEVDTYSLVRMLLLIGASALTVVRLFAQFASPAKKEKHSISYYRKKYAPILAKAFLGDARKEKKFFRAVEDYANDRFAPAVKSFSELLKTATAPADRYALLAFLGFSYEDMRMYARAAELYRAAAMMNDSEFMASRIAFCESKI